MNIREIYTALCERYPEETRVSYDFDGLQVCPDETRDVRRIVTALDLTHASLRYAEEVGADLILTHHPIFFSSVRTLDPDSSYDARHATELIARGIAHISLHTRFDAGAGGINDALAAKLALCDVAPFGHADEVIPLGRIGATSGALSAPELAKEFAEHLSCPIRMTGDCTAVHRVCVVGGSGGDYLDLFLKSDAEVFLTGELSHHHRIAAEEAGKVTMEAGHWGSEIVFCEAISPLLSALIPSAELLPFVDTAHEISVCG